MKYDILCEDGKYLKVNPASEISHVYDLCLISYQNKSVSVHLNQDGTISNKDAQFLISQGCAIIEGNCLFDQPTFCKAVFGWDNKDEVEFLSSLITDKAIDYGCGWGRNLIPLLLKDHKIDGVDSSLACIQYLQNYMSSQNIETDLYCCSMDYFIKPKYYSFAFSALNSIRYLQNRALIMRHFHCVSQSLSETGMYAFHISIIDPTSSKYNNNWTFNHRASQYNISWRMDTYNSLENVITDEICIYKDNCPTPYLIERQIQFCFTKINTEKIIRELKPLFKLHGVLDSEFASCKGEIPICGNCWIILAKSF